MLLVRLFLTTSILLALSIGAAAKETELPSLGDSSSGIVSPEYEHRIGRSFLRSLRSRTPMINDPVLQEYVEFLCYKLASHSALKDRRLEITIIDSPALNAFAAPGGIIGVNAGLFLYAESEQELSAILAHEVAHLSQRHFARGVEASQRQALPTLTALLASIVIAATVGGDAGIAALTSAQAASQQARLRYSRQREQEADRLGIQTMVNADMDPWAMPRMFERLNRTARVAGRRPPEFLLTHPVTESRIADSKNRARNYQKRNYSDRPNFYLMKERVKQHYNENPQATVKQLKSQLDDGRTNNTAATRYGLVLALTKTKRYQEAQQNLQPLLTQEPLNRAYQIAQAELLDARGDTQLALQTLQRQLALAPDNHPLTIAYAQALLSANKAIEAELVLQTHSQVRDTDVQLWYLLAETYGLAGNIPGVHQARAEYFQLVGDFDRAIEQLDYASRLVSSNFLLSAKITQRKRDILGYRKDFM